jgi:chromosomal replication initiation ATPase DnaA
MKTLDEILEKVSIVRNISVETIIKRGRCRFTSDARKLFCVISRDEGYTLSEIGRYLKYDHSSVIYMIRTARSLMELYPSFRKDYEKLNKVDYTTY